MRSDALDKVRSGERVTVAGLVLVRQRPGTAKGVIFMTLEDETGVANIIVWPKAFERLRAIVIGARFVAVTGKLQNEAGVIHIIAERMEDLTRCSGSSRRRAGRSRRSRAPTRCDGRKPSVSVKRQGNRFAQVQLFQDKRLPSQDEPPRAAKAMPAGRNFR